MKKLIFLLSLLLITVCLAANVYAMTGLNVSMSAPSQVKLGEEVSVVVTAEIPGGQNIQGIQVDFSYSKGFPEIENNNCSITKDTSGWSLVGIARANLLTVGERLESDAVVEGKLVFTIPEENALSQYTVYIESAIAAADGEIFEFNIENSSVTINIEGGGSSAVAEKTTENTAAGTSGSETGSSGKSGSSSSSSSTKETSEKRSETAEETAEDLSSSIIMKIGSTEMIVFGEKMTNDVPPIISNSRTMLPIRFISECMGAQVEWNGELKEITVIYGKTTIKLAIGSTEIDINGRTSEIDTVPFIENSRTYVPIRFISEGLGLNVDWNEDEKTVTITKN